MITMQSMLYHECYAMSAMQCMLCHAMMKQQTSGTKDGYTMHVENEHNVAANT